MQPLRKYALEQRGPLRLGPRRWRFPISASVLVRERSWAINLDVREGEFLCVVGSSGSGKTTLLRVIAGLARPAEGKIVLRRRNFRTVARSRDHFPGLFEGAAAVATVRGNVALSLEARNVPAPNRTLLSTDCSPRWVARRKRTISGPTLRRHATARADRALPRQDPKLLLMDEPFGALDAMTRQTCRTRFCSSQRKADHHRVHHARSRRSDLSRRSRGGARRFAGRRRRDHRNWSSAPAQSTDDAGRRPFSRLPASAVRNADAGAFPH